MKRALFGFLLLLPILLMAQGAIPVFLGPAFNILPPAIDASGQTVVFGSAITPAGANSGVTDLYSVEIDGTGLRRLTKLPTTTPQPLGANAVSLSAGAARAAFTVVGPTAPSTGATGSAEEVHVVDVASATDHVVAVDTQGCILPLEAPICPLCFVHCVNNPHITADGSKVLYSVRRNDPFYVVNADGTDLTNLPVFSGALAGAPQRVISGNGLVVFTSFSPFGPTFAASAEDVYVMNLDGTNIRNVTKLGNNASLFSSNATISADGGTIAFESNMDPQTLSAAQVDQIWLVHTDGSGLRALTSGPDTSSNPSISGDGSLIAFVRSGQIGIVHADGSGLKILTSFQTSAARDPVLSDDGSTITFDIGPQNGSGGAVYAMGSDGSNLHAVYAPQSLNQNGVTGLNPGTAPSPGSLFSAYGLNFAPDSITTAQQFPLPTSLAGVSLLVNGIPAPLLAVTPWQINAQLPANLPEGAATFQVRFSDGGTSAPATANVNSIAPVLFLLPTGNIAPAQAAAFHAGSAVPADQAHPAVAGETLEMYGTGLGPTDIPVPAGTPAPGSPPARVVKTPQVLIGNLPAQVTFAGLAPGYAGLYQVNAVVPAGLKPGVQTVVWKVGSDITSNSGSIAVQ